MLQDWRFDGEETEGEEGRGGEEERRGEGEEERRLFKIIIMCIFHTHTHKHLLDHR